MRYTRVADTIFWMGMFTGAGLVVMFLVFIWKDAEASRKERRTAAMEQAMNEAELTGIADAYEDIAKRCVSQLMRCESGYHLSEL